MEDFVEGQPDLYPFSLLLWPVVESLRFLGRGENGAVTHCEGSDFLNEWGITDLFERHQWRYYWQVMTSELAAATEERLSPADSNQQD